MRTTNPSSK